jgi:hydrophobe/amphiphile efflux-1 (HAE1) family protein
MSLAATFTARPISASVLSLLILLVGLLALRGLPISEFPDVVPPSIVVRTAFPGAAPETIADTVAAPIEEQMSGVPGLLYFLSHSTPNGGMQLTLTFAIGTRMEDALVEVQNRINRAAPRLPEEVRRQGVVAEKSSGSLTMVVHLVSADGSVPAMDVANFARLRVKDELAKVSGVGDVQVFGGGEYALRVWLDPERMAQAGLTPGDVVGRIREQNAQVTPGVLGAQPVGAPAPFELTITAQGRLDGPEAFAGIVLRTGENGALVRLGDVARIEVGAASYGLRSLLTVKPPGSETPNLLNVDACGVGIFQSPGSNALAVAQGVRARMAELAGSFPAGITHDIVYDPTVSISDSIDAVIITLLEAVALVVVVVIVFLQTWRASIIPLLAVPVSVVGTFAVMHVLGYSINNLSLFGLVLAIGIVVDDAIVVVENVERNIALGLSPRRATVQAMREVTGPIVATAAVLCAVFIPTAFLGDLTGIFYQQFAVTIAISTVISAINSLTLSPALSAVLLRPHGARADLFQRLIDVLFGWFFRLFNRVFRRASETYRWSVARMLRITALMLVLFLGLLALTGWSFTTTPTGFLPDQDKGYLVCIAQLPDGASLDRTQAVIERMSAMAIQHPAVDGAVAFPGLSINGFTTASNAGIVFVRLKPHADRMHLRGPDGAPSGSGKAVAGALNGMFYMGVQEAFTFALQPPPVLGLGTAGGFKLFVQDRAGAGLPALKAAVDGVVQKASQTPEFAGPFAIYSIYSLGVPTVHLEIDRDRVQAAGVALGELHAALAGYLGSSYANDLTLFGRTWQVQVQADAPFRASPDDLAKLTVRTGDGRLAPLSAFVTATETSGPERVMRYNGYPAIAIDGNTVRPFTGDQGQARIGALLDADLPPGMGWEWTEVVYQQELAGDAALYVYPICVLLVFLVLAALYESWTLPVVVILIVPLCLLFALTGVGIAGLDNDIMVQIGFLVLIGLACKNAILIVEFARDAELRGVPMTSAALDACRLRLRPILMTSIAFIMGVVPLVIATGSGAELRQSMGVAVFSGMIGVTIVGLALTPVFYLAIRRLAGPLRRPADSGDAP